MFVYIFVILFVIIKYFDRVKFFIFFLSFLLYGGFIISYIIGEMIMIISFLGFFRKKRDFENEVGKMSVVFNY